MSEEKHLSGEEKRAQLKEQYKKELRERQAFVQKVEQLRKQQKIVQALENMKVDDDTDEWIAKMNEETAFSEAKMELALENAHTEAVEAENKAAMEQAVAEEMIRELKKEIANEKSAAPETQEKNTAGKQGELKASDKPLIDLDDQTAPPAEEKKEEDKPSRKMLDGID